MNDRLTTDRPPEESGDGRVASLLRRAGVVEERPPPHVWDRVVAGLRDDGRHGAGMPPRPVDLAAHRQRRSGRGLALPLLAAAAVGALVTWVGLDVLGSRDGSDGAEILASGELAPLVEEQPDGTAEVVVIDGHHRLRLALDDAPQAGDGYLEVWLLTPDASGMVTLGVLEGSDGEYLLPPGLELEEYPVVDISREHMDGDPGHGGDSLVRGELG